MMKFEYLPCTVLFSLSTSFFINNYLETNKEIHEFKLILIFSYSGIK